MQSSKFRTAENQLRFSEQHCHVWVDNSPVCTKIIDLDFNLQFMSVAGIDVLGIGDVTEYYGKPYPFDFYPQSFCDEMHKSLIIAFKTGRAIKHEAAVRDIAGNELWFHSTITPISEDEKITYFMVVSIDTTSQNFDRRELEQLNLDLEAKVLQRTEELEKLNNQLHQQTETDFLTQLPNRLAFERRFGETIAISERNSQNLSLLMLDIDADAKKLVSVLHYNGDPINASFVVDAVLEEIAKGRAA